MTTELQKYLRAGNTPDSLLAAYGVKAKRHPRYPNLVQFKYDMLSSPMGERIVQESRGIILDEADGWAVVARGFNKFMNYGEGHAASIDWSTARVQEKVDGTCCMMWHYAGEWHVATLGSPDAGGAPRSNDVDMSRATAASEAATWQPRRSFHLPMPATFANYFWQVLSLSANFPALKDDQVDMTFIFELTGPLNRVVVQHSDARLTVLGARHIHTGLEVSASEAARLLYGAAPPVREYELASLDDIAASFKTMSPLAQEGYVVVDSAFRRVKVKHPGYVALHHAKDGLTPRAFVEIARSGETSEVVVAFPEIAVEVDAAKAKLDELVAEVEADYAANAHHASQKDFALAVKSSRCPAALFAIRGGKAASVREFLATTSIDHVMRLIGVKAA